MFEFDYDDDEDDDMDEDPELTAMNEQFMDDAQWETAEKEGAHAAFDAEQQQRWEAVADDDDDDDDYWSGPDLEEKAVEQGGPSLRPSSL
jgi:hypothetical protein